MHAWVRFCLFFRVELWQYTCMQVHGIYMYYQATPLHYCQYCQSSNSMQHDLVLNAVIKLVICNVPQYNYIGHLVLIPCAIQMTSAILENVSSSFTLVWGVATIILGRVYCSYLKSSPFLNH